MPIKKNIDIGDEKIWAISDIEGNVDRLLLFLTSIGAIEFKKWKVNESKKNNIVHQQRNDWFTADFEINKNFKDHIVINGDICSNRYCNNHQVVDILSKLKMSAIADRIHIIIGNHECIGIDGEFCNHSNDEDKEQAYCIKRSKQKMLTGKDIDGKPMIKPEVCLTTNGYKWLFRHGFNTWDDTDEYKEKIYNVLKDPTECGGNNFYDIVFGRVDSGEKYENIKKKQTGYGFFTYDQVERLMKRFRGKNGYKTIYCMGHDKQNERMAKEYAEKVGLVCIDNYAGDFFCIQGDKFVRFDCENSKAKDVLCCNSKNYSCFLPKINNIDSFYNKKIKNEKTVVNNKLPPIKERRARSGFK